MRLSHIMSGAIQTVAPGASLAEAARKMASADVGSLPVCADKRRIVGIITDRDITVRCVAAGADPKTQKVSEIMSADPITVTPDTDADEAARIMAEFQVRRLPVVDNGRLLGILVTAQLARRESTKNVGSTIKEISEPASGRASHARG